MFDDLKRILKKAFSNDKGEDSLEEKKSKINLNKNLFTNVAIVFLVGVLCVIVGSIFTSSSSSITLNKTSSKNEKTTVEETSGSKELMKYKEKIQSELISTLEKIDGVGKVQAMIYFESGEEQIPVYNENESKSTTSEKDTSGGTRDITQENGGNTVVMENNGGGQTPFISKINNPKITGVCVVAEGARDTVTELRIRQAVTILFGLTTEKVQVYPMKL